MSLVLTGGAFWAASGEPRTPADSVDTAGTQSWEPERAGDRVAVSGPVGLFAERHRGLVRAHARAASVAAGTSAHPTGVRYGVDVSWPQCGTPLPRVPIDFVVIGLTDGHAMSVNPCLSQQVAWARERRAPVSWYVVPNGPNTETLTQAAASCATDDGICRYTRAGALQAAHALAAARRSGAPVSTWWLDVEESAHDTRWGADHAANVAVLTGWQRTLERAGHQVGVYSTSGYWKRRQVDNALAVGPVLVLFVPSRNVGVISMVIGLLSRISSSEP